MFEALDVDHDGKMDAEPFKALERDLIEDDGAVRERDVEQLLALPGPPITAHSDQHRRNPEASYSNAVRNVGSLERTESFTRAKLSGKAEDVKVDGLQTSDGRLFRPDVFCTPDQHEDRNENFAPWLSDPGDCLQDLIQPRDCVRLVTDHPLASKTPDFWLPQIGA